MASERTAPRICFVSSEHPPYDKRVYEKEACSLAAAGFDVVHLCPDQTKADRPESAVKIVQYPHRRGKLQRLLGLPDLYRRASRLDADAYHCNEPDSWLVGVALRLFRGRRVVFDCHEHYGGQVMRWLPPGTRRLGALAIRAYLQLMALLTHVVVLAKYSVAPDFSLSARRTLVILNTTPMAALERQLSSAAPAAAEAAARPFRFVHIGVIRRERGSEQLLEAVGLMAQRGVRDFRLTIVGEFKDGSQDAFFRRAGELGVSDLIEFHAWMPFDQAFRIVLDSDAGLVLFQKDVLNNVYGMPHKMFDYMLAGIPVIAPDFAPDIVRVIKDSDCGLLIDTASPEAIAGAMLRLKDDAALRTALGRRGEEAVRQRYNWEAEAAKLVDAYRALLPRPRGASPVQA